MIADRPRAATVSIASQRPGRLRLKLTRDQSTSERLARCAEKLSGLDEVTNCRVAVDAASIVVNFKPTADHDHTVGKILASVGGDDLNAQPTISPRLKRITGASKGEHRSRSFQILHELPGRLRFSIPGLRVQPKFAIAINNSLGKQHGIFGVEVRAGHGSIVVSFDPAIHLSAGIVQEVSSLLRRASETAEGHVDLTRARDIMTERPQALNPLVFPTAAVAVTVLALPIFITAPILFVAALPITRRALTDLMEKKPCVDQLDLSALIVLVLLGDLFTGSLLTWLIGLGDFIRAKTMRSSRKAIGELMSPAGQLAWKSIEGDLVATSVEDLSPGDIVCVYPGDLIPVDGTVIHGKALIDQKILTGESAPVARSVGESVFALTTVADGQISISVEHIGKETRAGQVAEMIEDAPLSDTRVQNYAAMLGDRLVIPIFLLAGFVYLVTGDAARLAGLLILDFATGIRVSAPTTILSAMIGASRQGLFIKGGKAMERLANIDAIVFDKTGTLTKGSPSVTEIYSFESSRTQDDVLRIAACAEANIKHPAAQAIVESAVARGLTIEAPATMEYAIGLGVETTVSGQIIRVGSRKYMAQFGIDLTDCHALSDEFNSTGRSVVCVAIEDRLIGLITYTDQPRSESADVVQALINRGIKRIVMLTGDTAASARVVAGNLKITDVIADAFPEQKAEVVQQLKDEGYSVAVIGDGVNDSPAFTRADVGISLAHGADVAKETADVILLDNNLWGLPRAIDLSRCAMGILKQNINIVVAPTAIGMGFAVVGLSTPLVSTLVSNGVTVVAGLNALRPLNVGKSNVINIDKHNVSVKAAIA
jgi:heavy metal translocating P-type ATPase